MLGFTNDCYKDEKMCDKAVDNYCHELLLFILFLFLNF